MVVNNGGFDGGFDQQQWPHFDRTLESWELDSGNPQMAEFFRWVKYDTLPRYVIDILDIIDSVDMIDIIHIMDSTETTRRGENRARGCERLKERSFSP
jgi:hypothetical protein